MRVFYDFSSNNVRASNTHTRSPACSHAHSVGFCQRISFNAYVCLVVEVLPSFTAPTKLILSMYKVYFVENHCHRTHKMKWCGSYSFWKWPKKISLCSFCKNGFVSPSNTLSVGTAVERTESAQFRAWETLFCWASNKLHQRLRNRNGIVVLSFATTVYA